MPKEFPTGPVTIQTPIRFNDNLPDACDVVVIGAGVIGITSAIYLAREGLKVCVLEKGRVAGEQSSRNWGWVRQHGRDPAELPIMMESNRLWQELDQRVKGATGFKRGGIMYLASNNSKLKEREKWLETAKAHGLDSRGLSAKQISELIDQGSDPSAHRWIGATYTPGDARAEPWQAVPALANHARSLGVVIRENCAARALDMTAGRLTGLVSESGTIRTDQVVLAGGAWSSLFLQRHAIPIPQLSVRSSVSATMPMAKVFTGSAADEELAFRRRADGGYTISLSSLHDLFIGPDAVRHLLKWLPVAKAHWHDTRLRPFAPAGFPDHWRIPRNWAEDDESPFERMRVLEPAPDTSRLEQLRDAFAARFPQLGRPAIRHTWAGMIDAMPDIVPIVDRVPQISGLILATGMSGHGFGIGPAYGKIIAKIATGKPAGHDISRFRFSRFTDGSRLIPGPAI
jgi:glycine/D-amino acid oxidase-like deaminating enzyme